MVKTVKIEYFILFIHVVVVHYLCCYFFVAIIIFYLVVLFSYDREIRHLFAITFLISKNSELPLRFNSTTWLGAGTIKEMG